MFRPMYLTGSKSVYSFIFIVLICAGALLGVVFKDWGVGFLFAFFAMMLSGVLYAELSSLYMSRAVNRYRMFYWISGFVVKLCFIMGAVLMFNLPVTEVISQQTPWYGYAIYLALTLVFSAQIWTAEDRLKKARNLVGVSEREEEPVYREEADRELAMIDLKWWQVPGLLLALVGLFVIKGSGLGLFYIALVSLLVQSDVLGVLSNLSKRQREKVLSCQTKR